MAERLSTLATRYRAAPQLVLLELTHPMLVWSRAAPAKQKMDGDLLWKTDPGFKLPQPGDVDPIIFSLKKQGDRPNAFGLGITVGRTANNDLEVDHASVSRFHAWLQIDPQSGIWHVSDAESSSGTYCNGSRLPPKRPAPLTDGAVIGVGQVDLTFMTPPSFKAWLIKKVGELQVSRL
jgi:hypothetical protein